MNIELANAFWILACACLVLLMQLGFFSLETGQTRTRHIISIAYKNITNLGITIFIFWVWGFQYIYLNHDLQWDFFLTLEKNPRLLSFFIFQIFVCNLAVAIASSATVERTRSFAYILLSVMVAAIIYPVIAQSVWSGHLGLGEPGWLARFGFIDFAGASTLHSVSGWVALAAVIFIGPRTGRFSKKRAIKYRTFIGNVPLTVSALFLIFLGSIGLHAGSLYSLNDHVFNIILNTIIAAMASVITFTLVRNTVNKSLSIMHTCYVMIGALAAISACANMVSAAHAFIIGAVSCLLVLASIHWLQHLRIDDSSHIVSSHLPSSIWGCLAVALFGDSSYWANDTTVIEQAYKQLVGIIAIGVFSFACCYLLLYFTNRIRPLRINPRHELMGLNLSEHNISMELSDLIHKMKLQAKNIDTKILLKDSTSNGRGKLSYYYKQVVDNLYNAYKQAKDANAELELAERQRISGRIAAGVAHEIKNPLSVIILSLEYLERKLKKQKVEKLDTVLKHAKISSTRINNIIQELLDINQSTTLYCGQKNINDIIKEVLDEKQSLPIKDVSILLNLDPAMDSIYIDKEKIKYLIINLLVNAAHAIAEHEGNAPGVITISTESSCYLESEEFSGEACKLVINDNGPGFSDKIKNKVFDPFFTTRRASGGSGLGLSLVKQIVDLHGGSVIIENCKVSLGANISVLLPRRKKPESTEKTAP